MAKLEGKVAVITGATSGMALSAARLFRDEGAYVYITGRRQEQLDAAVAGLGHGVTGVQADSAQLDDLDHLFETVRAGHGRVDVLYVNAATGRNGEPVTDVTPETFDEVFALNVRGLLFTAQKALSLMPDGSSIVLTGSVSRTLGLPGQTVYAASKATLRAFAQTWAADLAPRRIRVNVLDPGPIETPGVAGLPQQFRDSIVAMTPAGRFGDPEEIATAALFLASDDSGFVNGTALAVDGGMAQTSFNF